jgi:hypothetical protein
MGGVGAQRHRCFDAISIDVEVADCTGAEGEGQGGGIQTDGPGRGGDDEHVGTGPCGQGWTDGPVGVGHVVRQGGQPFVGHRVGRGEQQVVGGGDEEEVAERPAVISARGPEPE